MPVILEEHALPFNEGERTMHQKFNVPSTPNPTSLSLNAYSQHTISYAPLIGLGVIDANGQPWSTVWGGESGFVTVIDRDIVGMRVVVDGVHDPVVKTIFGDSKPEDGSAVGADSKNKMISGVTIDLETRQRAKLYGKVIFGTLDDAESKTPQENSELTGKLSQVQLVVKIEESLANCPKYLHKKKIVPATPEPTLISTSAQLPSQAEKLLNKADCFFISSYHQNTDMDTNYRGGPSGFVRIISNEPEGAVLVYPEYSGNRLYQSLGNLMMNNRAGLVFPDFETGDALYTTVKTEILIGNHADAVLPGSNLAVKMTVIEARYVEKALCFRGVPVDKSPYTPAVRYLRSEKEKHTVHDIAAKENQVRAKFISKELLTPSVARFRIKVFSEANGNSSNLPKHKPGQYAVFSFKDELDMGYSHMRDDDPLSINDDYIRTFTVSSFPEADNLSDNEFEITVRRNRNVSSYMFFWNPRVELEVPLLGFGGIFKIEASTTIPFIAGGIGITPLLGQLPGLDISRLRLFWSISASDIGLVENVFQQFPGLSDSTKLFITQTDKKKDDDAVIHKIEAIETAGASVERHRITRSDLKDVSASTFYLCSGHSLQKSVLEWLKGKNVVYEDFTY